MLTKLTHRLKGDLILPLARTFIARGIAALGGLLLVMVLGQLYGPAGVGIFALAQSVYLGAGILARYGMNNSLMRFVGENHTSIAIKIYLRWAINKSLVLSVAAAVVVYLLSGKLAQWFDAPRLVEVMPGITLAIPAFTVAFVLGGFMKGIRRPATACLLENGSIMLIATGLVWVLERSTLLGIANAGWAMALAAWLVLGQGAWQSRRWFGKQELQAEKNTATRDEFAASSRAFFVMSLAQFMQQVLAIMIAGWLLGTAELGLFRAAERTAFLITFILLVINAVLPPRFATLYRQGNLVGLNALARKGALLGVALSLPLLLVCLLVPHWVLGLFGPAFSEAANLLRIIAVAQLVNVATGSVGFLLNMTGHEKLMRNIALICNALGLSMFFILIPLLGALGAAVALALVLVLQNLTALVFVWRKLGIWMLPIPNILKWMRNDRQEAL
ncbi:lipopolysaccharide biosynthesis protein [Halomonas maura]|uniref:lipopolysaccharide biosynthesis protein n=1 Tax=Halomonas maura TaxID=117606 RepID=UPI0025B5BD9E|nr:oligosaccharide flippase family protein [Halomonas maura]MDN3554930.1 oligosaccharide flippase family protein [Halomonas maura]